MIATFSGSDVIGHVFNGGTGTGVPVSLVLAELSAALGVHEAIKFNGTQRPGNPSRLVADTSLVRSLGWNPKIDWRQGIGEYAKWFRSLTRDDASSKP